MTEEGIAGMEGHVVVVGLQAVTRDAAASVERKNGSICSSNL